MKKHITAILYIFLTAALAVSCCYLYLLGNSSRQELDAALEQTTQYTQEISDLKEAMAEKDDYIQGQAAYMKELTEQLNTLTNTGNWDDQNDPADNLNDTENSTDGNTDFSDKYPALYAQAEYDRRQNPEDKTVYLTFDDGPSNLTPQVLDLLDEYNAKATFFVVYNEEYTEYLSEIVKRGHTLALHSYSHDYDRIYASVDAFLSDFSKVYDWVYEETGQRPTLFRFPGGSTNGKKAVTTEIIKEMQRRGFIYYDWNVSSGDGSNLTTTENVIDNISSTISYHDFPVVLMHDGSGKNATLKALPTVLEKLKNMGYSFSSLDETMTPVQYRSYD